MSRSVKRVCRDIYLCDLSKRSRNDEGHPSLAEFKTLWRKRLSLVLQLQRCNVNVIMKKIARISRKGDEDDHENDYEGYSEHFTLKKFQDAFSSNLDLLSPFLDLF